MNLTCWANMFNPWTSGLEIISSSLDSYNGIDIVNPFQKAMNV